MVANHRFILFVPLTIASAEPVNSDSDISVAMHDDTTTFVTPWLGGAISRRPATKVLGMKKVICLMTGNNKSHIKLGQLPQ